MIFKIRHMLFIYELREIVFSKSQTDKTIKIMYLTVSKIINLMFVLNETKSNKILKARVVEQ